jgi:hypothetical protein
LEPLQTEQADIIGKSALGGHRYWLENSYGFIDAAGEWYYDTETGYLYYKAYPEQTPQSVIVPVTETLLNIENCDGITLDGITFTHTNWNRPNHAGIVDIGQNMLYPADYAESSKGENFTWEYRGYRKEFPAGAAEFSFTDNLTVKNCAFTDLGGSGIRSSMGGDTIVLQGNLFTRIAAPAIQIGEDYWIARDSAMYHKNVSIDNNYVENTGTEYYGCSGICVFFCDGLTVSHNTVTNLPYIGISAGLGTTIGLVGTVSGVTSDLGIDEENNLRLQRNIRIENNFVENAMNKLYDGGWIYITNPFGGVNTVSGNHIKGNFPLRLTDLTKPGAIGIYHDGCNANVTDENNFFEDCQYPFYFQNLIEHGQISTDITVKNNYMDLSPMQTDEAKTAGQGWYAVRWLTNADARRIVVEDLYHIFKHNEWMEKGRTMVNAGESIYVDIGDSYIGGLPNGNTVWLPSADYPPIYAAIASIKADAGLTPEYAARLIKAQ